FGLSNSLTLWLPLQFGLAFNFPLMGSSGNAIWLSKVPSDLQGRVFSISILIKGLMSPLGRLAAGPLADRVFEPAMMPGGRLAPLLGATFGTGRGAGMAVLYTSAAIAMILIGLCGYLYRPLRTVESTLPDP
ncbi:MAG: MFS transporter, partial [Cyanobacteria bacterium P01_E01_bin.43]